MWPNCDLNTLVPNVIEGLIIGACMAWGLWWIGHCILKLRKDG